MTTRAQLTQERSRQRRDALLAAALELFAEGGSRSVTHRAVAARAGLPPATTTYYFASIDTLVRDALATHMTQWRAALELVTDLDVDAAGDPQEATDFVRAVFAVRTPDVAALELAIYLAAARDPELRDTAADALAAFERLAADMLERAGVADGGDVPAMIIALIAGVALRRQSGQHSEIDEARILAHAIRNLLAAHVLDDTTLQTALEGLRATTDR